MAIGWKIITVLSVGIGSIGLLSTVFAKKEEEPEERPEDYVLMELTGNPDWIRFSYYNQRTERNESWLIRRVGIRLNLYQAWTRDGQINETQYNKAMEQLDALGVE